MRDSIMLKTSPTIRIDIFMAGDIAKAKEVCREFCYSVGLCVHVEPVDYIYTGGEQAGFKVGLINYPRFEKDETEIWELARQLSMDLLYRLWQESYSIVGPERTEWYSRRAEQVAG